MQGELLGSSNISTAGPKVHAKFSLWYKPLMRINAVIT